MDTVESMLRDVYGERRTRPFPVKVEGRTLLFEDAFRFTASVRTEDGQGAASVVVTHQETLKAMFNGAKALALLEQTLGKAIDRALEAHRIDCEMGQGWSYRDCLPEA
jgi:hypothetical protein